MILVIWKLWVKAAIRWHWIPYGGRLKALMFARVLRIAQKRAARDRVTRQMAPRIDQAAVNDFRPEDFYDVAASRGLGEAWILARRQHTKSRGMLDFATCCSWEIWLLRRRMFIPKRRPGPMLPRHMSVITAAMAVAVAVLARLRCAFLAVRLLAGLCGQLWPALIVLSCPPNGPNGPGQTETTGYRSSPALEAAMSP